MKVILRIFVLLKGEGAGLILFALVEFILHLDKVRKAPNWSVSLIKFELNGNHHNKKCKRNDKEGK